MFELARGTRLLEPRPMRRPDFKMVGLKEAAAVKLTARCRAAPATV